MMLPWVSSQLMMGVLVAQKLGVCQMGAIFLVDPSCLLLVPFRMHRV